MPFPTVKEDLGCSPADLVYGTALRLPCDVVAPDTRNTSTSDFLHRLRLHMRALRPQPSRPCRRNSHIHPDLSTCPFVFVRVDRVRKPLESPYTGPYRVLSRHDKHYTIDRNGSPDNISIDRLKVAYMECPTPSPPSTSSGTISDPPSSTPPTQPMTDDQPQPAAPKTTRTRSGRTVTWPSKLYGYIPP